MNKILVTRSSMPDYEEYCEEIKELWDSHWLTIWEKSTSSYRQNWRQCWTCPM